MLNLFQKYRRPIALTQKQHRQQFSSYFFSQDDHAWIVEDSQILKTFEELFKRLPTALLTNLMKQPLSFIPSSVFKAQGPSRYQLKNTIVIFPEYLELLKSSKIEAVAFLAHEVALVLYELESTEDLDPMMAEVEADKFVCDMGLSDELEQLLLSMDESAEKRLRLTYLTFKAFGIN
jgi:hypothetical protein